MTTETNSANQILVSEVETALLEANEIDRVVRVTVIDVDGETQVIGAKISLDAELPMRQVSVVIALAERRVQRVAPAAKHVFITPDVYFDDNLTASTSAIVTLSYD